MAAESTVLGNAIDQRLDALDRALLGLLPRAERLAMVAGVEARVRDEHAANPAAVQHLASPAEDLPIAETAAGRESRRARRRSTLAFMSGVIGIAALALLFFMPVTYLVVATTSEAIGEIASYVLLSGNIVVVAVGGAAAVVMGIAALVRLNRRQGQAGHGWAITGLCTGPLPALMGGLATITVALPMLAEVASSSHSSGPTYVSMPGSAESCAVCPAPSYAPPAVDMPPPLVAAAPSNSPATGYPVPAAAGAYAPAAAPPASALPSLPDPFAPPPALPADAAPPDAPSTTPAAPLNTLPPSAAPQGEKAS